MDHNRKTTTTTTTTATGVILLATILSSGITSSSWTSTTQDESATTEEAPLTTQHQILLQPVFDSSNVISGDDDLHYLIQKTTTSFSIDPVLDMIKGIIKVADPTGVYSPQQDHIKLNIKRSLPPPILYQPPCSSSSSSSSSSIINGYKAIDFAIFSTGILTLIININNNINNNNNNNNKLNLNAVDSSNIVANFNTNNANQINIQPPGGKRRKRRSLVGVASIAILKGIQALSSQKPDDINKRQLASHLLSQTQNESQMKIVRVLMDRLLLDSGVVGGRCNDRNDDSGCIMERLSNLI